MISHKILANRKVAYAVKTGEINKPGKCEKCGIDSTRLHAHHPDYSKPLEVIWLCPKCHRGEHQEDKTFAAKDYENGPFWQNLDLSISLMVQQLFNGQIIAELVDKLKAEGIKKVSPSLLYKWANPAEVDARPSLIAFLTLVKICENCGPIEAINEACGKIGVPDDDYLEGVKFYTAEFEKRQNGKKTA